MKITPHIRWMIRSDTPAVLDIENLCFSDPWPEEEFLDWLRERNVIGMVAEYDGKVVAYMVYQLHKASIELVNMAVQPRCQRLGVGTAMIDKLKGKLHAQRRSKLRFCIKETNLDGQLFLRAMGMKCVRIEDRDGETGYTFDYHTTSVLVTS